MTHTTSRAAWGVDGCKAGWFWFRLPVLPSGPIAWGIVDTLKAFFDRKDRTTGDEGSVLTAPANGDLMLVDIPIGLPMEEHRHSAFRECDKVARDFLGYPRKLSVFHVPTRAVLEALICQPTRTKDDARNARLRLAKKRLASDRGGISNQSLAILEKIREADALMQGLRDSGARATVRETHPEVCFWALGGKPMEHSKKKREGRRDRRKVLTDRRPDSGAAIDGALGKFLRREVAEDDILDAMACAVTAARILEDGNALRTLPAKPPCDSKGSPMEIVYAAPDS